MAFNRRDWLKTALLGTTAFALSPLDILANEVPNFDKIIKGNPIRLCFNENPFGVSPKAIQAMQANLGDASKYDFGLMNKLKEKLSSLYQLQPENFLVTAGSSMVLELVAYFTSINKGHIIYPEPSFTIFSGISEFLGMKKTVLSLDENKKIDLQAMKRAIKKNTKLIYICNPNNPTGDLLSREEIIDFINSIPEDILVLLDEAYIEFSGQASLIDHVGKYKNLIIARTFSKIYGLAGARLGYAVAHPDLLKQISKLQSWAGGEVSIVTTAAGMAALDDLNFKRKVIDSNQKVKEYVTGEFKKNGVKYIQSASNFLYFSLNEYQNDYFERLKINNILGGKTYEEKGKWTRISLGTEDDMKKYVSAIFG